VHQLRRQKGRPSARACSRGRGQVRMGGQGALERRRTAAVGHLPQCRGRAGRRAATEGGWSVRGRGGRQTGPGGSSIKCRDVVRRKVGREGLAAGDCGECRKFYDAVMAGDPNGLMAPAASSTRRRRATATALRRPPLRRGSGTLALTPTGLGEWCAGPGPQLPGAS